MHTYLIKVYKPDDSLDDSYTLEAEDDEQATSQAKAKLSDKGNDTYRVETQDLTVLSSAGATKPGDTVETAPMDEPDAPETTPQTDVQPLPSNDDDKQGTQAMDASDDFADQAKLLTDKNIDPPIKKGMESDPLSAKKQKQANDVKKELLKDSHK